MTSEAPKSRIDRPGRHIQNCLLNMQERERMPFLAYLEQSAGRSRDAEILEAIRDYRLMVEGRPHLRLV